MKTFLIAEAGINHNGDLQIAKDLATAAMGCGCSAVKFQTYDTDKRVKKGDQIYDILKKCELSYVDQEKLKIHCDNIGIEFFSTPFDKEALGFLVDIDVKKIKIASFDITNKVFLEEIASCARQDEIDIIMSTGMANTDEIMQALRLFWNQEKDDKRNLIKYDFDVSILHCVSSYPMKEEDANLAAIPVLKDRFVDRFMAAPIVRAGYSDHSQGIDVPAAAIFFGAEVIEKHFTLDLYGNYVDNPVSADPKMMRQLVEKIEKYETYIGDGELKMSKAELAAEQYRRK
jgi:sialic acid synthase SpsE